MTKREMTEIFAAMKLAYPNAEMFKGGIEVLKPTIELWTSCLADVDFWVAQQALVRVCRECKFPPTIAEFKTQVEAASKAFEKDVKQYIRDLRTADFMNSLNEYYTQLSPDDPLKKAIDIMGGVSALVTTYEHAGELKAIWNWDQLESNLKKVMCSSNALGGRVPNTLPAARKE
jgi:hypothetical protein